MKRGDPSHSRISAVVGVAMPAGLEGTAMDIGGKVRPCTPLVDRFWIRSAIHSHQQDSRMNKTELIERLADTLHAPARCHAAAAGIGSQGCEGGPN